MRSGSRMRRCCALESGFCRVSIARLGAFFGLFDFASGCVAVACTWLHLDIV
jgi:hypothetical protein